MSEIPPLNALRAFDVTGHCLNFRAAADALGVTQSAVAQQVRQLEAHLGQPMFHRESRGLSFTAAGRAYHAKVSLFFEDLRSATASLRPSSRQVLISVTPTFASKWLIPNLPELAAIHPEIDLRILATESVSSFHRDGIHLAVRQGRPPFGASLSATQMFSQHIIAVAAPMPELSSEADHIAAFSSLPRIYDAHDHWPAFLQILGLGPGDARGLRLNQTALAIDAAKAGQGIALVSRFLVAQDLKDGTLLQVSGATLHGQQDFYILTQRKSACNAAIQTVRDWLCARGQSAE